jgi:ABC-type amino acid transport substrate-binding protein
MKKNIFSFTSAAVLLLAVSLAGCSREDANENGTRATFLKVSLAETRATTAPTGAVPATFTAPGMVLFTTSSGTIVRK